MTIPLHIKNLLVFLFYNVHTISYSRLTHTIATIQQTTDISIDDKQYIKKYLLTLIFHTRNSHYGGLNKRKVSYDLVFMLYSYYPKEIINIIELFIYYGSFKDINTLIRLSSYDSTYLPITNKCYQLYAKYIITDYYKCKYFVEHKGTSVFVSDCARYIPKENKNLDKRTNATHEIVKILYPRLYTHHPHSALKQFRKLYQPILRLLKQSSDTTENTKHTYSDISFTFLSSEHIYVRALANSFYTLPDIRKRTLISYNYLSNYRSYIIDYLYFTCNISFNYNIDIYRMHKDTPEYILTYYEANMDFFWNTITTIFDQECYNSISSYI